MAPVGKGGHGHLKKPDVLIGKDWDSVSLSHTVHREQPTWILSPENYAEPI